jgi:kumamolisin
MSSNILVSIYLKRDLHENGMTLKEYADAVIAGTHPILEHDEFVYQFGAVKDELDLVVDWAQKNNLTVFEADVGIATVKVQGTQEQLGKLFSVELRTVVEPDRTYVTHDGEITIPSEINSVVDHVLGLDNSFVFRNFYSKLESAEDITDISLPDDVNQPMAYPTIQGIRPNLLASAYQTPKGSAKGASIGIIALTYSGYVAGWNQTDVNLGYNRIGITPPIVQDFLVDGSTRSTTSDTETIMDIYCSGAAAGTGSNITVYMAPNTGQGFLDGILACANDTVNNPTVLSISWGSSNELSGDYLGSGFTTCVAKGITVFVASGDAGANNLLCGYPHSNPYVVSAGGTRVYILNNVSLDREFVWNDGTVNLWGTGGGISKIFSLPSWQTGLHYQTYSITTGSGVVQSLAARGTPDFSSNADPITGFQFYINSVFSTGHGGTSAAAPVLAGLFAKLNVLLGRRVGFVNSFLYAHPEAFTDTTTGDGFVGNNAVNKQGYLTTAGWDPTTGLGSPNMSAIYGLYKQTSTSPNFPKQNYNTRPTSGASYPRITQGAR